eukprot:4916751-Pleurochrysis_carterae.AAC.1
MNAVTTDVNNTSSYPALDDWQADLFGVISPPVSAHAAWADDCDEIDMCTEPTVHRTHRAQRHRMRATVAGYLGHAGH